jgi:DNA-damage-inducible protein D
MQEIADPERSLDRTWENRQKLSRSEKWIQQRMTGHETRNNLTGYWKESGVEKSDEFAFLAHIMDTKQLDYLLNNIKTSKD